MGYQSKSFLKIEHRLRLYLHDETDERKAEVASQIGFSNRQSSEGPLKPPSCSRCKAFERAQGPILRVPDAKSVALS